MPLVTDRRRYLDVGDRRVIIPDNYVFGDVPRRRPDAAKMGFVAVQQGEQFHAMPCQNAVPGFWWIAVASWGYVYGPIHPDMAYEDVEGATYAHDTGTNWQFAHCSPHEQIDFAAAAEQFCFAAFQPHIDRALQLNSERSMAQARALLDFAEQAGRDVFNKVRMATLGEYHRDPHKDHRRDLAHLSIVKIWTAWLENTARLTDRNAISSIVGNVGARLNTDYAIEWRHERAPAWIEAGRDPVSGKEWCSTLSATGDAIAGDANLPDPNWHFDAFGNGITKGAQFYTDGKQTATEEKPWIIWFHRPLPIGVRPAPGVSMGSVAWTQDEAIKAYMPPPAE